MTAKSVSILDRYATGAWLTPRLMAFAALAMIAGTLLSLGLLVVTANGTVDAQGRPLGTDFSSFWTAGRMALDGRAAAAYDWTAHAAVQKATHGVGVYFPWSYPPTFLLVAAVLALLPYTIAWLAWQSVSLLAAVAVFRRILPGRLPLLLALGFPAVLVCWGHGQTGFLTAALLAGGAITVRTHPVTAGVLFGLLAYKPQFGLIIPFVLIAGGHWRTFASAAITAVAGACASIAIWDWPLWQAFFDSVVTTRALVFETGDTGFAKFQSVFAWMRMWGQPLGVAYGAQALVTGAALAGCVWAWRTQVDERLKAAALIAGTLLSTPYMLDYDLVAFGMAVALLVSHGLQHGFARWEKTLLAVAWFAPAGARSVATATGAPLGFLVLLAVFVVTLMHVRSTALAQGQPQSQFPGAMPRLRASHQEPFGKSA